MTDTNDNLGIPHDDDTRSRAQLYKFGTDRTKNTFKISIQSTKFRLKTATQLRKEKSETTDNENKNATQLKKEKSETADNQHQSGLFNQISQAIISKTKAIRRIIPNQNEPSTTSIASNKPQKNIPQNP